MGTYSIKDLEQLSGIKAHTLRMWEQRYELLVPQRTETNIRFYKDEDLRMLLNIAYLNRNGKKISQISKMTEQEIFDEVVSIADSNLEPSNQTSALVIAMVNLDESRFEKIIGTNALQFGLERTMTEIVYPFLKRIGILWQTGNINPAHEHFISGLIRQKLIVAIDGQLVAQHDTAKKYVLYLPEGELHEISLLFAAYIVKSRYNKLIYLGQSLPQADLEAVCEFYKPDVIFTLLTNSPGPDEVVPYVQNLVDSFPDTDILVSGYQAVLQKDNITKEAHVMESIEEFITYVDETSTPPFSNGFVNHSMVGKRV
ncbi:MAG: MerR family transcriptional regulator [Bacteroidia bacterium]